MSYNSLDNMEYYTPHRKKNDGNCDYDENYGYDGPQYKMVYLYLKGPEPNYLRLALAPIGHLIL